MRTTNQTSVIFRFLGLSLLLVSFFAFRPVPGGDVYQIFLNDKLLLKQLVIEPIDLRTLSLEKAKPTDKLVVYYSHCGTVGKGRAIKIQNSKGEIVKQWQFPDSEDGAMVIPVKELIQLKTAGGDLRMTYSSREIPKGRMLTSLRTTSANTVAKT